MSKKIIKKIQHQVGSDNIFADLGLEDADELLTRAKLGYSIRMILKDRGLNQKNISDLLKIDQSEVSKLMNGKYHLFSEGRLFGFLNRLDRKVAVQISPKRKNDKTQEIETVQSEMEMRGIQDAFKRMQPLKDVLTDSYLDELQRASEILRSMDMGAVARLQELTHDWAEPLNNIQNILSSYSNKIAELNRAISHIFDGLSLKALEIQKTISEPLTKALENYQEIFRDPFKDLFPEGFFKEIALQEGFVEDCKDKCWVPHPVLYSFCGDDFFTLSNNDQEERIKENWEEFSSRLWERRPANLMENGREERLKQIFNTQKVKAYMPVCRSVYPEIESLAYEYVGSDITFLEFLKKLPKGEKKRAVSEKINTIFKIKQSPILDLYISELGGLLGYRTVETLLTVTRAEFIPLDETDDDLSMNRHFHVHGIPYNPTFKDSVNALLLLDTALQAFSALRGVINGGEDC